MSKSVRFCACFPEAVQLVYQGYLPSTPKRPQTAFSIRLLQIYYSLHQTTVCVASGFIEGILNFLDPRSNAPLLARGDRGNRRNLTQPFSTATHLYNRIMVLTKRLLHRSLDFTKSDHWADRCARCFGPAKHEIKQSPEEPDVIFCMDGNFQHRHNALASKDEPEEHQYPDLFVRPSQIEPHNTAVSNAVRSGITPVNDVCISIYLWALLLQSNHQLTHTPVGSLF